MNTQARIFISGLLVAVVGLGVALGVVLATDGSDDGDRTTNGMMNSNDGFVGMMGAMGAMEASGAETSFLMEVMTSTPCVPVTSIPARPLMDRLALLTLTAPLPAIPRARGPLGRCGAQSDANSQSVTRPSVPAKRSNTWRTRG